MKGKDSSLIRQYFLGILCPLFFVLIMLSSVSYIAKGKEKNHSDLSIKGETALFTAGEDEEMTQRDGNKVDREEKTQDFPPDADLLYGTLSNGVRYYIQKNQKPENRAELFLVVKAGSFHELEEQRGLAHFVEHMNFAGTQHFSRKELIGYLESIGVSFGPDINAYTTFDATAYSLHVPVGDPDVLSRGFLILRDWAGRALFQEEEIDQEREIVHDEWRVRKNAWARMQEEWYQRVFDGTRYAKRLPIGLEKVILHCDSQWIRGFYQTWYRPDLMAVIAVGDFEDIHCIEDEIHTLFDSLSPIQEPPSLPEIEDSEEGIDRKWDDLLIMKDPEVTQSRIWLSHLSSSKKWEKVDDLREELIEQLFCHMVNQRMEFLIRDCASNCTSIELESFPITRSFQMFHIDSEVKEGKELDAFYEILLRLRQIFIHGFTEQEWTRAKREFLLSFQLAVENEKKTMSREIANRYKNHFLNQSSWSGIRFKTEMREKFLENITLEEVLERGKRMFFFPSEGDTDRPIFFFSLPEKEMTPSFEASDVRAIVKRVEREKVEKYEEKKAPELLIREEIIPGKVVGKEYMEQEGIRQYTLSNGMKVYCKQTSFKNNECMFSMFSPGGISDLLGSSEEEVISGRIASDLANHSGAAGWSDVEIKKFLAGRGVELSMHIDHYTHSIGGWCRTQDLETALQLLYIKYLHLNREENSFSFVIEQMREEMRNRKENALLFFKDRIREVHSGNHPALIAMEENELNKAHLDHAFAFIRRLFSSPEDFSAIFVGDFEEEILLSHLENYLAAIPVVESDHEKRSSIPEYSLSFPEKPFVETLYRGNNEGSRTALIFPIDYRHSANLEEQFVLNVAAHLLEKRLLQVLRLERGETYSVSVHHMPFPAYSRTTGRWVIYFASSVENRQEMIDTVFALIQKVRQEGFTEEELQAIQAITRSNYEESLQSNAYWLHAIEKHLLYQWEFSSLLEKNTLIDQLTTEKICSTFMRYLPDKRYATISLLSKKQENS